MVDLVGTCPKTFWEEWLEEGDCAGDPETGAEYYWGTHHRLAAQARPGNRFYIVAHGRLRGWAPIRRLCSYRDDCTAYDIVRAGGAVACTLEVPIPGFQGLRVRWWEREQERPFPEWRTP